MKFEITSSELRKFVVKNAKSINVYPDGPLPKYLIFAGENLFTYPKNDSSSVLLNVEYNNRTSELLSVIVDGRQLPEIQGNTTLLFVDFQNISYFSILDKIIKSNYPLHFSLLNESYQAIKIQNSTIFGNVNSVQQMEGILKINASDSFGGYTLFDIPFQKVEQYNPNQVMVLCVFLVVVLVYSIITAHCMSKPHHKISLTVFDTKHSNISSTSDQDSACEAINSKDESIKAIKSPIPSSLTKDMILKEEDMGQNRHTIDINHILNEPIQLETIKIAPMSKHETFMEVQVAEPGVTVGLVSGESLPKWIDFISDGDVLMLHPNMDDLGTYIVIVRKWGLAIKILQIIVEYQYDEEFFIKLKFDSTLDETILMNKLERIADLLGLPEEYKNLILPYISKEPPYTLQEMPREASNYLPEFKCKYKPTNFLRDVMVKDLPKVAELDSISINVIQSQEIKKVELLNTDYKPPSPSQVNTPETKVPVPFKRKSASSKPSKKRKKRV